MPFFGPPPFDPISIVFIAGILLALLACPRPAWAQSAYVRVNQVGYETGQTPFRAYLMSTAAVSGATFKVVNSKGVTAVFGQGGALLGTWSHSKTETYDVYALDFHVPGGDLYTISVSVRIGGGDFAPLRRGHSGYALFRLALEYSVLL